MGAYFITATGTDIGKTFVTAGLAGHLRRIGEPVAALKPVMSGFDGSNLAQSDAGVLLAAQGEPVTPQSIARISPWRFAAPLSPDMAAAREGRTIDFAALVAWCREEVARPGNVLIEAVGGVMVPLDGAHTVLDWMCELNLPLILVTGTYLGTISHTLTAMDVCQRHGLKTAALVVNESAGPAPPFEETAGVLLRFAPHTQVVALPRAAGASAFAGLWRALA